MTTEVLTRTGAVTATDVRTKVPADILGSVLSARGDELLPVTIHCGAQEL